MNPESLPTGAGADDSPSADDLLALIPDMELLETSALDAREAHVAIAASAGRRSGPTPTLTAPNAVATAKAQARAPVISDDPYADLMPELESFEDSAPTARAVPVARPAAAPAPAAPAAAAKPPVRPPSTSQSAPKSAPTQPPQAPVAPAPRKPVATVTPVAYKPPVAPLAKPASPKKPPNPDSVVVPPVMDKEFIARNRIVELYLSGGLPVRGATVFERYCQQNPQILDEIGLPERVHAGLRLLEASGKPEPWQEKPKRFWERPYVPLVLAVLVVVLGSVAFALNKQLADQTHKVAVLHQLIVDQPLDAAAATTNLDIQPTHGGPAAAIAAVVGGSTAQLVNIKLDMTHSDYRAFRVTIDRKDQGRVEVLNNLIKDSNGALGFSLNTSALGAGTYQLTIEGLDWRGDPQPDSWAAISLRH